MFHLFSLSLSQHYLPKDWRIHQIRPIFKSGDKTLVKNYRPISLLSCVSKVLERIVYNNIIWFLNNFVSDYQFGFLQNRSTLQQLIVFFHHLQENLNNKSQVDVVDFKKASDTIVHNVLLYKLWCFGITDNIWHWIRVYLTDRVQCVSINGSVSGILPVVSGVPQGSILGPLLFLVFVNDIPSLISSAQVLLFADDVKCSNVISSSADCTLLQQDLDAILD